MSKVVDVRQLDDHRDAIHDTVHRLIEGGLVGLPTETGYVLAAHSLHAAAIEAQAESLRRHTDSASALLIRESCEAFDFVPRMTKIGRRLVRRCWPGPVVLVFAVNPHDGLLNSFPEASRRGVCCAAGIRVQVSAERVIQEVLSFLPGPLIVSTDRLDRGNPLPTAEAFAEQFRDDATRVLNNGPARYGEPATVVAADEDGWRILAPGVITETMLNRLGSEMYLFVCTGNTCRSPMAEGLFRKLLSERLQCSEDEVPDRGFVIESAGLSAAQGLPASPESIELLAGRGIDLSGHVSQPLTDELLDQADHIYAMTREHRDSILAVRPEAADRIRLLSSEGVDIPDPIGYGIAEYRHCGQEIERGVQSILAEVKTHGQ